MRCSRRLAKTVWESVGCRSCSTQPQQSRTIPQAVASALPPIQPWPGRNSVILPSLGSQPVELRMGSFTSAPKILNEDHADDGIEGEVASPATSQDLLEHCRKELSHLPPLLRRTFRTIKQSENPQETIRVFQWNILSQALGEKADHFVCCPDAALDWRTRRWRILEEILSSSPDIICLQEVDHYHFLKTMLETVGYTGTFFPKPDSPCYYVKGNNGPDGCAIFYDTYKFELLRCATRVLEVWTCQSNQVTLLCIFRRKVDGAEFCIATTHLKARQGGLMSSLRNEQGKDLMDFVTTHAGRRPTIITGDFNAEPSEPVYRTILSRRDFPLESSYTHLSGGNSRQEPPYTTWKIRDEGEISHTIDYIFHSKQDFEVERLLQLPTGEQMGEGRVPSFTYPSDHFSLVADLRLPLRDCLANSLPNMQPMLQKMRL